MTMYGYARVSTREQNLDLQVKALKERGCIMVWHDKISGTVFNRVELDRLLTHVEAGDVVCIWKLDRLGRSLRDLIDIVDGLRQRGVGFISLNDGFDTTTPGGRMLFHIVGAIAEYERELIRMRTYAGLDAARDKGHVGGRRPVKDTKKVKLVQRLHKEGEKMTETCKTLGISKTTYYRYIKMGMKAA